MCSASLYLQVSSRIHRTEVHDVSCAGKRGAASCSSFDDWRTLIFLVMLLSSLWILNLLLIVLLCRSRWEVLCDFSVRASPSFVWVCAGRRERASPSHPSKSRIMPPYFGLFGRRSSEMLICEARYYSYRRPLVVANVYVRRSSSNLRLLRLENPLFWTKNWWETFRVDFFRPFFAGQYLSPK